MKRSSSTVKINGENWQPFESSGRVVLLVNVEAVAILKAIDAGAIGAGGAVWQVIYTSGGVATMRMRVPNGWLVKHTSTNGTAMAFVSDPGNEWSARIEREA